MTALEFGDVVLVPFSFTDQSAAKQRPAVVISSAAYHRARPDILMAITSQARSRPSIGEAPIRSWKEAGLIKPSVFKPLLATVDQSLVRRTLGRLEPDDLQVLRDLLPMILGS